MENTAEVEKLGIEKTTLLIKVTINSKKLGVSIKKP